MQRKKAIKLAGFVGALAASATLVSISVSSTGAYFTDSKAGAISGSSGHLKLAGVTDTNLSFAGLMPGTNVDKAIDYSVNVSSGGVDLWMVFDPSTQGYQAFTGGKHSPQWSDGGLGRYGYFKVADSNGGTAFRTGNLSYDDYATSNNQHQSGDCPTDVNGRGGSDWIATAVDHSPPAYCGVPSAIRLANNLVDGQNGTVTVTFGLNGYMQTQQDQPEPTVGFHLVATQHGVRPDAPSYPNS